MGLALMCFLRTAMSKKLNTMKDQIKILLFGKLAISNLISIEQIMKKGKKKID